MGMQSNSALSGPQPGWERRRALLYNAKTRNRVCMQLVSRHYTIERHAHTHFGEYRQSLHHFSAKAIARDEYNTFWKCEKNLEKNPTNKWNGMIWCSKYFWKKKLLTGSPVRSLKTLKGSNFWVDEDCVAPKDNNKSPRQIGLRLSISQCESCSKTYVTPTEN